MSVDAKSSIRTLVVWEATRRDQDEVFDVDPHDDTIDKGLKKLNNSSSYNSDPNLGSACSSAGT